MSAETHMELAGRCAIVTGGAGGIGRSVALALARAGASICVADSVSPRDTIDAIGATGGVAIGSYVDVTRAEEIRAMTAQAEAEFGGVDILVTTAGVTGFGSAATLDEREWDRILSINLKGTFLACQSVIEPMRKRGGGRIITIGSVLAKNGGNARPWLFPDEQQVSANVAYGASKAGVHAMTAYLARELAASRITVNGVAPGPIASDMTTNFPDALKAAIPLGRMGAAADVAAGVLFFASAAAAFITGEIMDINGGMWAD
ncbi:MULTISPECIES: SDR family oxidoreductase [unclassified Herbaspirillum]|uniref:SDR family NAD(P)-dependent oxidoreductase n=1 Tax=unclassified Herbaspirillum TaxID=2624150 RepID=UPI000E2FED46|nr:MULTISPECIES: SDR family oxidoreductase [unclassified Herbaspirillum]RFB70882.1 SDR family oxidoreductase [Herbaspirillum sp. 3R-3a1]TFI08596.1 SDR family oxidoreductase [Herbaspirillum sp. 3R11]TFI15010.1 SDR family oxidoreductase [Herbaspirillum sp. 3R-11]TFI20378.1 SDR family oxidoreductase [Herbaspirillum sp. 3C11]